MQLPDERRSAPRIVVNYPVIFFYAPPNRPATKMLDLSAQGAAVETDDPLPIGASTSFLFLMNEHDVIECNARVISVQPLAPSKYRVGVRFLRLADKARELVLSLTQADGENS